MGGWWGGGPGPLQREAVGVSLPRETVGKRGAFWCSRTRDPRCGPSGLQGPPPDPRHPGGLRSASCLSGRARACERVPSFLCTGNSPATRRETPRPWALLARGMSTGAWLLGAGGAAHRAEAGSSAPPPAGGRERVAWQCPSPPVQGSLPARGEWASWTLRGSGLCPWQRAVSDSLARGPASPHPNHQPAGRPPSPDPGRPHWTTGDTSMTWT